MWGGNNMQSELLQATLNIHSSAHINAEANRHSCHCAFAVYANVPVIDERGRYCSACGYYEFLETVCKN